ncbi:MAG: transposase [Verrucomicrobiota bacterium]|nr:transposase [Verrucomicrobiota bacterium]MDE3068871.1 transposase [Verrucomicrobiota bacterium]
MARKLRVEYAGAIYHVMNRGDRREPIFKDDQDRRRFLETLGEACLKTGWQVHAYSLMPNHFHLVMETPRANLVSGMKWFLGTYTSRFNRRHKLFGHLFSGRYKSLIVDGSGTGYLKTVCDYVHLNPVRAKMLNAGEPLKAFAWSSYPEYCKASSRRPGWLRVDRLLGETGIPRDTAAGRRQFELRMEERRAQETGGDWKAIRRGWYLGDEAFRKELLAQMRGKVGKNHYGGERQESAEEEAERIVRTELDKAGWSEEDLRQRRKGDPRKVRLALRLRKETTMTLKWIAERLAMGSWKYLNGRLYEQRRESKSKQ